MPLPFESLGDQIAELASHINAATARLLDLIADFDESGGWADEGCLTCAHWLNWKCGISPGAAREKVRVARALRDLPAVHAALARAEISYSKVRALTRVATEENEDYLLMVARHGTAAHMDKVVRGVRRVRTERELDVTNEHYDDRSLESYFDDHGMLVVHVRLAPEQGARLLAAVNHEVQAMRRERDDDATAEMPQQRPSFGAMRADALLRLIDGPNPDTEIVVHVCEQTLRDDAAPGQCELEAGPTIAPESARRHACDAGIVRLVEDPDGQPLDVGRRTRSIPPALRRALRARDRGCRFPGCDATAHVEGHHVQHWAHGGDTAMHNLVTLCRHHHRLVHEGRFGVEHCGHGAFRFLRPDGRLLDDTAPRYTIAGEPDTPIREANHRAGLHIDAETGASLWDGWPMDEAQAVEGALSAEELAV